MAADARPLRLVDPAAAHDPILGELHAAFDRVALGLGEDAGAELEEALRRRFGLEAALAVSGAEAAIVLVLRALGIGPGDEVVLGALGLRRTASAILRVGARPVLCDVGAGGFHLDPEAVAAAVTERARAIVATHLFGQTADLGILGQLAEAFAVPLIEDAGGALGAASTAGPVGTAGRAAVFSLGRESFAGALGRAGLFAAQDPALGARARALRDEQGLALDPLPAAILRVKLAHVASWSEARRRNASLYDVCFLESGLAPERLALPRRAPGDAPEVYVVRTADRDALRAHLGAAGIETGLPPAPLHLEPGALTAAGARFPNAEAAAATGISLPVHPGITGSAIEAVVDEISRFFGMA